LAGCAILDAVWDLWPSDRLRVADRGLREGVLLSLMNTSKRRRSRRRKPGGGGSSVTAS
ncbi:MAG: Ppx/GppA family phosphatase, partial [Pseudomonadota bacterium]